MYVALSVYLFDNFFTAPPMVEKFSKDLCDTYKDIRKKPRETEWPPYQPTSIVNVTVIHYKNKQARHELIKISEHFTTDASGISKLASSPPSHSKVTKNISEIFKVDPADQTDDDTENEPPKLILIEGAPGIGKTVLAKEIAYLWANHKLLDHCKLVILVYLRDPRVHTMKSVKELLQLYISEKISLKVNDYLEDHSGQGVAFVFDGFDEFPALPEGSIVKDIIGIGNNYKRKFHKSIVVITSRPAATLFLHKVVDRRIEILGFAPEERDLLISQAISQFPNKKIQLEKYFSEHPFIGSLCYVPLNLAIILYLFCQNDYLPETLTEMNKSFVFHIVYRHLKRIMPTLTGCIYQLTDVPESIPVNSILQKLSKLSFSGLQKDQLVFTEIELRNVCPEVFNVPEAANGFSLLQAVEHHPQKGAGTTTSFNFLHLTVQEYLAASYVSTLPKEQQIALLWRMFWDDHFSFMWIMYVGIVGVKSGAFASFVRMINVEQTEVIGMNAFYTIQQDKKKCLHLFHCYMEAKGDAEIPRAISSIFSDGKINLAGVTLLPHHVASLLFFLCASSTQQWKSLELNKCNIQRTEMYNVYQSTITNKERLGALEYVNLSENGSSPWGVYCAIIKHCSVNSLTLCGDEGMKEYVKEIIDSLQTNKTLESLKLFDIGKSGIESIKTILVNTLSLQGLYLSWKLISNQIVKNVLICTTYSNVMQGCMKGDDHVNINVLCDDDVTQRHDVNDQRSINLSEKKINDDAAHVLAFGLCNNTTVVELNISQNDITVDGAVAIIDCLKHNNTIKKLDLSHNKINSNGMDKLLEEIDSQGNILLHYVDLSKNGSSPWGMYCVIIRHCCINSLTLCGDEGMNEYIIEIAYSLQANTTLQALTLCNIGKIGVESIKSVLMNNLTRKKLNLLCNNNKILINVLFSYTYEAKQIEAAANDSCIVASITCCSINVRYKVLQNCISVINLSNCWINDDVLHVLTFGLCYNTTVKELNISYNEITIDGALAVILSLNHNKVLKKLNLSHNKIIMNKLSENILTHKSALSLEYVDLRNNYSSPWSVYYIIIRGCIVNDLTLCGDEGMDEYIKEITDSLQANTTLQSLKLFDVGKIGVEVIKTVLMNMFIVTEINASWKKTYDTDDILMHTNIFCATNLKEIINTNDTEDNLWYSSSNYHLLQVKAKACNSDKVVDIIINGRVNHLFYRGLKSVKEICNNTAYILAFGLCNNTVIEELDISHSNVTDEGAIAIIDCLKHNKTLKKLNLSHNRITINGMNKMLQNIEKNGITLSLEHVDLSKNQSSPWGVYCAIIRHCCVNNLSLCGDEEIKEFIDEIFCSLQGNTALQSLTLDSDLNAFKDPLRYYNFSQMKTKVKHFFYFLVHTSDRFTIKPNVFYEEDLLPTINLSNLNIDNDDVINFIKSNSIKPEKLIFSHNKITCEGVMAICDHLRYNEILKELDLSQNKLSTHGMGKIVEKFENQGTTLSLEYVDLSKNQASQWGVYCAIIRYCCVNSLTLCGDEGMKEYVREITVNLQANTTLQSLTLCNIGKIGVESIKAVLANNCILKVLNLSWKKINDVRCKIFSSNNDNVLETISDNTIVMNISILYDDETSHIKENDKLLCPDITCIQSNDLKSVVNLSGANINDDAAYVLAFGLCYNTTVVELNISHNRITDKGAIAIMDCLKYNKTLKKLDLSHNLINIIGMNKLFENIENQEIALPLEYVDLSKNCSELGIGDLSPSPWSAYCAIIKLCCANSLTLCGNKGMKHFIKDALDRMQINNTLQSLKLHSTKLGFRQLKDDFILTLSQIKTKKVYVSVYTTNHNDIAILINSTVFYDKCLFTTVDLSNLNINDDDIIYFIKYNNVQIEKFNLSCNTITDNAVSAICDYFKCNETLKELDLSQNKISTKGMKLLEFTKNMSILEYVDLSGNCSSQWEVYCIIIKQSHANSLTLVGDEGMNNYIKEITDSMQANTTLQSLTLFRIGKIGINSIKIVLVNNFNLKKLNLSWEKINNREITESDTLMPTFLKPTFLKPITDTKEFEIQTIVNKTAVNVIIQVGSFFKCSHHRFESIAIINLSYMTINDDAAHVLAFGLCNNTTVVELNISNSMVSDEGAIAITDSLKHNKTLKTLDLSCNKININGMNKMLEIIENQITSLSLEFVNLSRNQSSPWGVYCAVIKHCCINTLALCGDEGINEYIEEITDSLQVNSTLQLLLLYSISDNGFKVFKNVTCSLNRSQINKYFQFLPPNFKFPDFKLPLFSEYGTQFSILIT